jgi:hypothetical protein
MTRPGSPILTLNNGIQLPALGFGVFRSAPEQTVAAVEAALAQGYRLVDTAASYLNEREVGAAIARSGVAHTELFVQTKLWISDYGYDSALRPFVVAVCCPRDFRLTAHTSNFVRCLQPEARFAPHSMNNQRQKHL